MATPRVLALITVVTLLIAVAGSPAAGQAGPAPCGLPGAERWQSTRPSPLDSAYLSLDSAAVTVCYSRPQLRGRSLDSLLPAGRSWRTGANEPTLVTLSARLRVAGALLDPGRYILVSVPGPSEWRFTFFQSPDSEPARMFETMRPVAVGRGTARPLAQPVERFTISGDSADAAFHLDWGRRRVDLRVQPPR